MDETPPPTGASHSKTHSRNASYNRTPLARRPTKGPLDGINDPPAPETQPRPRSPILDPLTADAVNTAIPSAPFSPERGYSSINAVPPTSIPAESRHGDPSPDHGGPELSFLLRLSIYHPLPLPLTLPTKAAPPSPTMPLQILLRSHNYRAAALHCADRLSRPQIPPLSNSKILSLFYTRLATLVLLGYTALAASESLVLEDPNSSYYHSTTSKNTATCSTNILPWHLRVLLARLATLAHNNPKRSIAAIYELAREARLAARSPPPPTSKSQWKHRLRECGINIANALLEAGDEEGAARCLEGLRPQGRSTGDERDPAHEPEEVQLNTRLALTYLSLGDLAAAEHCFPNLPAEESRALSPSTQIASLLPAFHQVALGDYSTALNLLRALPQSDTVVHNLAVCLFYMGRKDETEELLEGLVEKGRGFEALTFNLATCFELGGKRGEAKKVELAVKVGELMGERDRGWFKLE